MSAERKLIPEATLSDAAVAEFLRANPAFFESHPELLAELRIPHPVGRAVSLIERQVALLRDQNRMLNARLRELVGIARDNDRLNERMQQLGLALFEAGGIEDVSATLEEALRGGLGADAVSLVLITEAGELPQNCRPVAADDQGWRSIDFVVRERKPLCGPVRPAQAEFLFGAGAQIGSAAIIPLGETELLGVLAVGGREQNRFQSDMGTLFLTNVGRLIGPMLRRFLDAR